MLRRIAALCGRGGGLLIGIDLKKDAATIEAAYNDRPGVTAEFNLNLLRAHQSRAGCRLRSRRSSTTRPYYNAELGRVEIYLVSRREQQVTLAGETFEFAQGEAICTEYSHKYTRRRIRRPGGAAPA